jgi:hypothetical protein|tara:strand:- start:2275 stop:2550 length:276 start_codon:yes stop_codon:yes gene_type:complete
VKPQHDHTYWAMQVAQKNTHAERVQFLKDNGFTNEKRIDVICHLSTYWLPPRMYNLPNRLLNAAYKDLPCDTTKTIFKVGVSALRKKYGIR